MGTFTSVLMTLKASEACELGEFFCCSDEGNRNVSRNISVFCHHNVAWEQGAYGSVPYGAVVGGHTSSGETLYVGRVLHNGTLTPGKIQPSHRVCYISFGGQEIPFDTYEVLINK